MSSSRVVQSSHANQTQPPKQTNKQKKDRQQSIAGYIETNSASSSRKFDHDHIIVSMYKYIILCLEQKRTKWTFNRINGAQQTTQIYLRFFPYLYTVVRSNPVDKNKIIDFQGVCV